MLESAKNNLREWLKVSDLQIGMKIAVPKGSATLCHGGKMADDNLLEADAGDILWDEIVSIKKVGVEQVYDIEVEGTHNFVAGHLINEKSGAQLTEEEEKEALSGDILDKKLWFGGIFAHNTYISGNVGIGDSTPTEGTLTVAGTGYFTGTITSGGVMYSGGNFEQQAGYYVYPGSASGLSAWQTSYYIASHSTWGLYTNTSFNIQGVYDVGNRVCSGQTCNIGATTVYSGGLMVEKSESGISNMVYLANTYTMANGNGSAIEFAANVYLNPGYTNNEGARIAGVVEDYSTDKMGLSFSTNVVPGTPTWDERMRITSGGNVGIGTSAPLHILDIAGTNIRIKSTQSTNIGTDTSGSYFGMNTYYNSSTSSWENAVDGAASSMIYAGSGGNTIFYKRAASADPHYGVNKMEINTSGNVVVASDLYTHDGGVHSSSDIRLKDVTGSYTRGLAEILNLNTIVFNYKVGNELDLDPTRQIIGLSAQEVQNQIPEAVEIGNKGYLTLTQGPIVYAMINAIKELSSSANGQQTQITTLGSLTTNNTSEVSSFIGQQANLNLQISEKYSILTGQIDTLKKRIENDPYQMQISGLETKINSLEEKLAALEPQSENAITTTEETKKITFQSFSENTDLTAISTNLANPALESGSFGGDYAIPDAYNEIRIANQGVDVYSNSLISEYLEFQIYIENSSSITDIVAELGNQMDSNEIQWNKDQFQNLTSGWNTVKLDVKEGTKIGDIDWAHLNYMRVYFKFSDASKVKISDVKIEVTETVTRVASAGNSDDISLSSQYSELLTKNQELVSQMADIKAQTEANTSLLLAMDPKNMVYKDILGNVDLMKGKLEAGEVVAGTFTIKITNDGAETIGKGTMLKADEETGADGKSVIIKTKAVSANSKIFVTPKTTLSEPLAVTETVAGESFRVEIKNPVEKDVGFDWWIIESR